MKRVLFILIFLSFCLSGKGNLDSELVVPLLESKHTNIVCHSYKVEMEQNSISVPFTYRASKKISHYTPGGSSIQTYSHKKIFQSSTPSIIAFDRKPRDKECPTCGGKGYITSDGDLYTTWYKKYQNVSGVCTSYDSYHDECDETTYGEIYHHSYYLRCPTCKGTGRVNMDGTATGENTQDYWYYTMWSHRYTDEDHDGHCDQHWWHEPIELDICSILFLIGLGILYGRRRYVLLI